MNKKFLIYILVLLALGVAVFFMFGNNAAEAPENPANNDTSDTSMVTENELSGIVIVYTDSGYSPDMITVPVGTAVTFSNESSGPMWTASNIHPTHTIYPGTNVSDCGSVDGMFDACESIPSGESWSFTFDAAGSWNYHNHMRANHGGTVVVE